MTMDDTRGAPNHSLGFLLTVVAGLATVLGTAFIPALKWGSQDQVAGGALGFAAGVMLYVSFVDVLGEEAKEFFENHFSLTGEASGHHVQEDKGEDLRVRIWTAFFFFAGLAIAVLLDVAMSYFTAMESPKQKDPSSQDSRDLELIGSEQALPEQLPEQTTPHSYDTSTSSDSMKRVSVVTFIALSVHNIPEGLATFVGGGTGSMTVPFAIAIHNILEGAAIAIPCYQATRSMCKAFRATFIAGMAQPIGAGIGWLLIGVVGYEELPEFFYGAMYSATAGIMVCVSLMELIPEALAVASARLVVCCTFLGFAVMECSIILLGVANNS
mmetsp:Transcript_145774/g.268759  ORF Transcript_145774/g.268759 Transcript_145774/m.268759 type:complete len:327 (+) Transcript_145774:84-1064(+)